MEPSEDSFLKIASKPKDWDSFPKAKIASGSFPKTASAPINPRIKKFERGVLNPRIGVESSDISVESKENNDKSNDITVESQEEMDRR